ncbi:UNVERIFIED_CONTAM: hypothetical protein GTU68_009410, partial [Idotea baltica]|nr:hypothetical protein [Idotea baltica]
MGSDSPSTVDSFDAFAFHSPFCKLVQKSFARLVLNDFKKCPSASLSQRYPGLERFRDKALSETYFDKEVEKAFLTFSKDLFEAKTKPSLLIANQVGNMYTPSLYGGLASILANSTAENLSGKRIGLFSYGSGLAATMFSIKVSEDCGLQSPLHKMVLAAADIHSRLEAREKVGPSTFTNIMNIRETTHHKAPYTPCGDVGSLFPGTWHLTRIDPLHR